MVARISQTKQTIQPLLKLYNVGLIVALLTSLLLPTVVHAQATDPQKLKQAEKHYEEGKRLFNAGKIKEALSEHETAWQLYQRPRYLINQAECYYKLWSNDHRDQTNKERAVKLMKQYLQLGHNPKAITLARQQLKKMGVDPDAQPQKPSAQPNPQAVTAQTTPESTPPVKLQPTPPKPDLTATEDSSSEVSTPLYERWYVIGGAAVVVAGAATVLALSLGNRSSLMPVTQGTVNVTMIGSMGTSINPITLGPHYHRR